MNMDFGANKAPVEIIKDEHLKEIFEGNLLWDYW